jgi:hypothetical protein
MVMRVVIRNGLRRLRRYRPRDWRFVMGQACGVACAVGLGAVFVHGAILVGLARGQLEAARCGEVAHVESMQRGQQPASERESWTGRRHMFSKYTRDIRYKITVVGAIVLR